jgi:hypothetical protein
MTSLVKPSEKCVQQRGLGRTDSSVVKQLRCNETGSSLEEGKKRKMKKEKMAARLAVSPIQK